MPNFIRVIILCYHFTRKSRLGASLLYFLFYFPVNKLQLYYLQIDIQGISTA